MEVTIYVPVEAACPKFGVERKSTLKKGPNQLLLLLLSISKTNFMNHKGACYVYESQLNGCGRTDKFGNYYPPNFKDYSEIGKILGVSSQTVTKHFNILIEEGYIEEIIVNNEKIYIIHNSGIYGNIDRALIAAFYRQYKKYDVEAILRILSIIAHAFSTGEGFDSDDSFTMTYEETCENINRSRASFSEEDYYYCIGLLKGLDLIECELIKVINPRSHATHFKTKITKVCCQLLPGRSITVAGAYAKSEVESMIQKAAGAPEN